MQGRAAPACVIHVNLRVILSLRQIRLSRKRRMIPERIDDPQYHIPGIHLTLRNRYLMRTQRHRPVLPRHVQRYIRKPVQLLLPHGTHMELTVRRNPLRVHLLRRYIMAVEDDVTHPVLHIVGIVPAPVGAEGAAQVQRLTAEEMLVELRLRQRLGIVPRAAEGGVGCVVVALDHQAAALNRRKGRAELVDVEEEVLGQAVTRAGDGVTGVVEVGDGAAAQDFLHDRAGMPGVIADVDIGDEGKACTVPSGVALQLVNAGNLLFQMRPPVIGDVLGQGLADFLNELSSAAFGADGGRLGAHAGTVGTTECAYISGHSIPAPSVRFG
ncbi:MAG: hypothetical protein E7463_15645 [Ruminococcaceae bacterium]|nr:hypothetical protein [Oscillospiraceae bacterium]